MFKHFFIATCLFVLLLYACRPTPGPIPSPTDTSPSTPDPTPTCYLQPQPTGEKYIPANIETPAPAQVQPGQPISIHFSGGYIILNNARVCGENNIVGYIYDDELPSFSYRRTVQVSLDDNTLTTAECDNECAIEVIIPAGTAPGIHQLILQIPRIRDVVFDIDIISTPVPTPSTSSNKLGVHLLLADGRHDWPIERWSSHMQYARQAVGEWGFVLELVRLDDLDPARWQRFMDLCAELHLTPVLRLATSHEKRLDGWTAPPQDTDGTYRTVAAQYTQFVTALRWPTEAHYIVVGNEPNHGPEWGGQPNPAAYARFLVDVADALHAADPSARILNAGFDPYAPHTGHAPFIDGELYMDEETFLDQMIAAQPDVFTRLDAWASHAYPLGPFTEGPWEQRYQIDRPNETVATPSVEPPPGIYNRGINGYEWELWKLSTYGLPPLPVLITETGWRHAESTYPADLTTGHSLPEAETAARYLDLALRGNGGRYPGLPSDGWTPWLTDPRVMGVVFFSLNGHPSFWGQTNLLALDPQGRVLATYAPFDLLTTISSQP